VKTHPLSLHSERGFSLIEVVIAIGIATFAIISIFGLFNTSLSANKDASAQQEGLELVRAIPAAVQSSDKPWTNFLTNVSSTLFAGANPNTKARIPLYVFQTNIASNPTATPVYTTVVSPSMPSNASITPGLQFYVLIGASTNAPTNVFGAEGVDYWPGYPLTATVYQIATWTATNGMSNRVPTMIFDFILPK
jgi:type II secretory pathway pseudopilin PulG